MRATVPMNIVLLIISKIESIATQYTYPYVINLVGLIMVDHGCLAAVSCQIVGNFKTSLPCSYYIVWPVWRRKKFDS